MHLIFKALFSAILLTTSHTFGATFLDSITPIDDSSPKEDCAMWWPTKDDDAFEKSETIKLLSEIYEESDGYESLILAPLMAKLGYVEPDTRRIKYPDEAIYQTVQHSSGSLLVISADQEHGIRIRFPVISISAAQRNEVLKDYLAFVREVKTHYPDVDRDPAWDPNALAWWKLTLKAITKYKSEGNKIAQIGLLPAPKDE
jgi:hypothetical protein